MNEYPVVRLVDFAALAGAGSGERWSQELIGSATGSETCQVTYIVTPPGSGSPAGLHVHEVDQAFYLLAGTMSIEVDGAEQSAGPGSLIVFPKGVPHRNWNAGNEPTVHLAINTPVPDPDRPFARSL
jgi:quercetin dioxygenase-like cupin family protein